MLVTSLITSEQANDSSGDTTLNLLSVQCSSVFQLQALALNFAMII